MIVKLNYLGDIIQFLPTLEILRNHFDRAHISFLTTQIGKQLVEGQELVDRIFISDPGELRKPGGFLSILLRLRKQRFDMAIASSDSSSLVALLLFLCGIPVRVGFTSAKASFLYNVRVRSRNKQSCLKNFDAIRRIGLTAYPKRPGFLLDASDCIRAKGLLGKVNTLKGKLLVGLQLGSKRSSRRWPVDRFAALADLICEGHDTSIVLLGTLSEKHLGTELLGKVKTRNVIDLTGKTTLMEVFCVIKNLDLLVCHSSGPMHVAFLVGTPTVSLWGASSPEIWGPVWETEKHSLVVTESECRGCELPVCRYGDTRCMQDIAVNDVFEAVKERLKHASRAQHR